MTITLTPEISLIVSPRIRKLGVRLREVSRRNVILFVLVRVTAIHSWL
jgi:hypothetical protein